MDPATRWTDNLLLPDESCKEGSNGRLENFLKEETCSRRKDGLLMTFMGSKCRGKTSSAHQKDKSGASRNSQTVSVMSCASDAHTSRRVDSYITISV
jgi:hypothetical protein